MKLQNSTTWPDHFLRRMTAWCCRQIGLPVRSMRRARFGNKSHSAWGGRGGTYRIYVAIGPESIFPVAAHHYPGRTSDAFLGPRIDDRTEALVAVTAHELTHCLEHQHGLATGRRYHKWGSERKTMFNERIVLELFRKNRETLLMEWNSPIKERAKPVMCVQEQRAAKAAKMLAAWERKAKLAKTKIAKYRRQVRYYERVAASRQS